jgi:hypothetical protein
MGPRRDAGGHNRFMLAYVFWHAPAAGADLQRYEGALLAFQRSLDPDEIPGFRQALAFRVRGAPWVPGAAAYEDWYLVDGFAALGALNTAAVTGQRRQPHDQVAVQAPWGAAGLYAPAADSAGGLEGPEAHWFDKPRGMPYEEFLAGVDVDGAVWQRQMVLGPSPEFCALGTRPPRAPLTTVRRSRLGA